LLFFSFIAAAKFLEEGRELNMKTSKNVCTRQPFQTCRNRRGERVWGDKLTLSQPEEANCAHCITTLPELMFKGTCKMALRKVDRQLKAFYIS
jgi:hypothetical protein